MAIAWLVVLGFAPRVEAQVFRVQAGASSLYQTQGASLYVRAAGYEGMIGVGNLDPFRVGITVHTRVRAADLTLGDANVPFHLPTDVFDAGHSFLGRGVGVGYQTEDVRLFVMGGTTTTGFSTPYTFGAMPEDPVGLVFLEGIVSPTVRVSARSLFSEKATSILGVDWNPASYLGGAVAGGAGSEAGYFATSMRYERDFASVKAGFVHAGDQFHRVILPQPEGSEMDGPNAQVTVRPMPKMSLTAAHNGYLQPSSPGQPSAHGTVNQLLAGGVAAGTTLNAAFFQSEVSGAGGTGVSFSAGRSVAPFLNLSAMVMRNRPRLGEATTQWVGNVREILSPRFELLQVVNTGEGNTSVSFGGSFTASRLSGGVDYQTIYVPFAVQNQFRQALMLHVRLQAVGNLQANLSSYISPDGDVKYTFYASQFLYRGESSPAASEQGIYDNVIRGVVNDGAGNRVSGAALKVDGEIVYTDSQGSFLVRKRKAKEYDFEVLGTEFLTPGVYEVVHAPARVAAQPEASATDLFIVVRRVPADSK
jgi:hypothetical protein